MARPASNLGPEQFAAAVLKRLGIQQTPGAMRAMVGWERAEGGHWHNNAHYNPLNTTQNMPGSGDTGSQGNISSYRNWQQGVEATVKTLQNGRYGPILRALRSGNAGSVANAIGQTPWGTSADLIRRTIGSTPDIRGVHAPSIGGPPGATQGGGGSSGGGGGTRTTTTITPGVDNSQARAALVQSFLGNKNADVLDFALQARNLQDIPEQRNTVTQPIPGSAAATADPAVRGAAAGSGAAQALNWVQAKLDDQPGSRETGGANQGRLASYLNSRFGMSGAPWCAMFTSAAVTKGGAPPSARTASVAQVRAKAQNGQGYQRGFVSAQDARPGDLVLFGNSHIGMITSVHGGQIQYVGGNQSNTVSKGTTRAGGGVSIVRPKYGARR